LSLEVAMDDTDRKVTLSAETRRAKATDRARAAESGWSEYRAQAKAAEENTLRLRALRLARDAELAAAAPPPKKVAAPKAASPRRKTAAAKA
jgi:hypothetical protein